MKFNKKGANYTYFNSFTNSELYDFLIGATEYMKERNGKIYSLEEIHFVCHLLAERFGVEIK